MDAPVTEAMAPIALPDGVIDLAKTLLADAGQVPAGDPERMLFAPRDLERGWPEPSKPIAVSDGFVHADILDEDRTLFEAVLASHADKGAEAVASAAQELRLPVTPYRRRQTRPRGSVDRFRSVDRVESVERIEPAMAADRVVIDLSTHWAGPLTTSLLAKAGATVIKVDPSCRPDGFGVRPRLYEHLNGEKDIVDLDLRVDEDRSRFESLLGSADLLVESFSRRVMPNLGYGSDRLGILAPSLRTLSIRAFPTGSAEQDWLGYGPAVHAASGLAYPKRVDTAAADHQPSPAPIAYPDFLAGLTAYRDALALLGTDSKCPVAAAEVSLLAAIAPLLSQTDRADDPVQPTESR